MVSLSQLVAFGPAAFVIIVIKLVGAAYMCWLGVQALRHRRAIQVTDRAGHPAMPGLRAVRQGFVVGISNPKAFMMFAAVLPQFVDRSARMASQHATFQRCAASWLC